MKQRYLLDFDDVLNLSFLTPTNSCALITGLNNTGTAAGAALSVPVGGLGNTSFVQGQTLIFDGSKIISSGAPPVPATTAPLRNDDLYYTKAQIDALFASLNAPSGPPVAYSNLTGAPNPGHKFWFLNSPIQVYSGSTVMGAPVAYTVVPAVTGQTVVAALVTVTCSLSSPDSGTPALLVAQMNLSSPQIIIGEFFAAGSGDFTAGCTNSVIPVDPSAQSFYYQQINNYVAGGNPIVLTLIGYIYL